MIYLVVLNDEPIEILSAWSTHALATAEIERLLAAERPGHDYYWMLHRLEVKIMHVDTLTPKDGHEG